MQEIPTVSIMDAKFSIKTKAKTMPVQNFFRYIHKLLALPVFGRTVRDHPFKTSANFPEL
jgi:hypothetical protein